MFGNIGKMAGLLGNFKEMGGKLEAMKERLKQARFIGEAGAGQARATVDGRGDLVKLEYEPTLVQSGDGEMLADLACAAVRDAMARSREALQKELSALTGGLELPGLTGLLGG